MIQTAFGLLYRLSLDSTSFDITRLRSNKSAWFKIEPFVKQARADGYEWLWPDAYCIPKRYKGCAIYYAWLSDISSGDPLERRRSNFDGAR
jgi:hypothetical protein